MITDDSVENHAQNHALISVFARAVWILIDPHTENLLSGGSVARADAIREFAE
ncbi:MAG: hypothetical protein M3O74_26460 [Pseudomonadota bacterium]|nr:hypothetical protein [Pseudomonadota bacterium]